MSTFSVYPQATTALLSFLTYISALSLTSASSSLRPLLFFFMTAYLYLTTISLRPAEFTNTIILTVAGCNTFTYFLQYADQVLLGRWTYEAQGPTSGKGRQTPAIGNGSAKDADKKVSKGSRGRNVTEVGVLRRLYWGAAHANDGRFLDTLWEAPNVPPFDERNPSWVPSRGQFLRRRVVLFVVNLLLLDYFTRAQAPPEGLDVMLADEKMWFFSRWGDVTLGEIAVRYVSSGMLYFIAYLWFQTAHTLLSIVMVGLGISEVKLWRPFIGNVSDAWSVRQFWGYVFDDSLEAYIEADCFLDVSGINLCDKCSLVLVDSSLTTCCIYAKADFWVAICSSS